jgi:hypothetical protein
VNTGDSGLPEVRQRRLGVARKFAQNSFHMMLDTQIVERESSHGQTTSISSNPLNLGETRWEEEENTRGLHGEASKPEEEVSGGLWRRRAGGNGGSGAGEAPVGNLGEGNQ